MALYGAVGCAVRPAFGFPKHLRTSLSFFAPLTGGTAAYGLGSTTPTFTRATVATHVDASTGLVVRDASGVARFEANGYLSEGARTNICLYSDDLTQAGSWTATTMTVAYTSTGPDGEANTATRCTATGANSTLLQAITSGSAARITSCWIKRITGTGNIDLTQDNGTTWTTVTVTTGWTRVSIAAQTIANPTVGIRIVTSGDAVDVSLYQHEVGAFITSAIPTTSGSVARNAEYLTFPSANNAPIPPVTYAASADRIAVIGAAGDIVCTATGASTNSMRLFADSSERPTGRTMGPGGSNGDLTATGDSFTANIAKRVVLAWRSDADASLVTSGVGRVVDTTTTRATSIAGPLAIGNFNANSNVLMGHVRRVMVFGAGLSDYDMARLY